MDEIGFYLHTGHDNSIALIKCPHPHYFQRILNEGNAMYQSSKTRVPSNLANLVQTGLFLFQAMGADEVEKMAKGVLRSKQKVQSRKTYCAVFCVILALIL